MGILFFIMFLYIVNNMLGWEIGVFNLCKKIELIIKCIFLFRILVLN